jgi:hypothetical protein
MFLRMLLAPPTLLDFSTRVSYFESSEPLPSASALPAMNGSTYDCKLCGPSAGILLHNASQLLMTSVNLPFNSPTSICSGWTVIMSKAMSASNL